MIQDEKNEGIEGGSGFQVLADQAAEQNYAVNVYKGSGNMAQLLDSMEADGDKKRAEGAGINVDDLSKLLV